MVTFSNFKGDLSGASTAAIISLPACIGYGIIVFAPLGPNFTPYGALLGLYTTVFAGFCAAWLGGNPVQISGPKAPSTLVLAALFAILVANPHLPTAMAPRLAALVGLVSLTILIGGIFQICLGSLGYGNLIKYVPYAVVAGFTDGIAVVLVQKQLGPLLGLHHRTTFTAVLTHLVNVEPLTIAVGLVTLATIFLAPRWIKAIPGSVVALLTGTALYYVLGALTGFSRLGPAIGRISNEWPVPKVYWDLLQALDVSQLRTFLPIIIIPGLVLGLLGSLESLLTCVASDNLTGLRHKSNRELVAQGIGNIVSSCFGGIFAAGSVPRTVANFRAGGRTPLSGILCSLILLVIVLALGPLVGQVPQAVIAGIIIAVAIRMVDKETVNIVKKLITEVRRHKKFPFRQERELLFDLFISMTVAATTIIFDLIIGVACGIVLASLLFISKMGKSVIRRQYYGDEIRSKKLRQTTHSALLAQEGRSIVVFELQGPLFFGSAEILAKEVEQAFNTASYGILDMKRVNEIDSTGASIILHMITSAAKQKKHLLITYLKGNPALWKFIELMDVNQALKQAHFLPDTDAALEWAEEQLLEQLCPSCRINGEISLDRMEITQGLTEAELAGLQRRLQVHHYQKGELIIRQGDNDWDLYLLTKGAVTIKVKLPHRKRDKRLITFGSGVIFGEMALLDAKARSADVWAEEDSEVLVLPYQEFVALSETEPRVALILLENIAKVLSKNLRRAERELQTLEDI
jgi:SulP family sulfate permease